MITEKQAGAITRVLEQTVASIPAQFALLSDITGQVVGAIGDYQNLNLLAISSLAVGDLSASQEIARLTGENDYQQISIREGKSTRILMAAVGDHLALFIQMSNEVPLGWARLAMLQTTKKLAEIIYPQPSNGEVKPTTSNDYALELDGNELSDLLDDALDDIWKK
jgi:predicted regulator of Ras-like GTPase activity (Roadblock/LC7/MglB family)